MGKQRYNNPLSAGNSYNAAAEREENYVGKKIAEARKKKGLSLHEFSALLRSYGLAIQRQGVNKWELGMAVPNAYQFLAVCHALEIEDGVGFFTKHPAKVQELNDLGQQKLREYREDLIASGRYNPQVPDDIVYLDMPVSTLPASAGTGAFLDEENFELLRFPAADVPEHADFGVRVSGDSMEPVYHDGQIVWVQQCSDLAPGEVGLFLYDGDGYIKVYGQQEPEETTRDSFTDSQGVLHPQPVLISYNEAYPPRPVSPELAFSIAGRVLS